MVLTYDAYNETLENRKEMEDRLSVMEQQFSSMQSQLKAVISSLTNLDQQSRDEIAQQKINPRTQDLLRK